MKKPFLTILNNLILQSNIHLNQVKNPIFIYIMKNKDGFIRYSIKQWINEKDIFRATISSTSWYCTNYDQSSLYWAVLHNNTEIARMLIDAGADLNSSDEDGYTSLYLAVINNNPEIVRMLIAAGANLNLKDNNGLTAEQIANTPEMDTIFKKIYDQEPTPFHTITPEINH